MYRYYYTGLTCDVVERGVLAGSVPASSATLEDLAVKGWVVPLPGTSRYMRGQWTLTDAGREEIERLMGGKG